VAQAFFAECGVEPEVPVDGDASSSVAYNGR
jgi:hypothetical protein